MGCSSVQRCASMGGVWDDTEAAQAGGDCRTAEETARIIEAADYALEEVTINVSQDQHVTGSLLLLRLLLRGGLCAKKNLSTIVRASHANSARCALQSSTIKFICRCAASETGMSGLSMSSGWLISTSRVPMTLICSILRQKDTREVCNAAGLHGHPGVVWTSSHSLGTTCSVSVQRYWPRWRPTRTVEMPQDYQMLANVDKKLATETERCSTRNQSALIPHGALLCCLEQSKPQYRYFRPRPMPLLAV